MKSFKWFMLALVIILLCARLALPYFLIRYVENQINKIPEYRVKIDDLDVHLIRGAYTIKHLQLWKINKKIPVPFYEAKLIDFSIEWKALLNGSTVAKITMQEPLINFVTDAKKGNEQLTISSQWIDIVKSLYPLNINLIEIHNGKINLISYTGNPPYKIYVSNVEFFMNNMQKTTAENKLLSSVFSFTGNTKGGGFIDIQGKYNPFAKSPLFVLQAKLNSLKVKEIGAFLKHYSSVDAAAGVFSMYAEVAAAKGQVTGYIKPFIKNLKIAPPENNNNLVTAIVDGAANMLAKIIENPKQKTIATKINISGKVDDPDASVFSIIIYFIRHAFIQALLPQIDHTVKMENFNYGGSKSKFVEYKN